MDLVALENEATEHLIDENLLSVMSAFEVTLTGLQVNGNPTYEQWVQQGRELWYAKQSIQWCIGDWINYGEHAYGEKYSQAIDDTDYTPQTLMNYAYTARAIEPTARRENVSFSNHSEVASLDTPTRERFLDKLEGKEWNREDVRREKRTIKGISIVPQGLQDAPVIVMQIGDKAYAVLHLDSDYPISLLAGYVAKVPKPQAMRVAG
jgi:hypothetical protein